MRGVRRLLVVTALVAIALANVSIAAAADVTVVGSDVNIANQTVVLVSGTADPSVEVDLTVADDGVDLSATVRTADRTGVEMEALTAVAVGALALIDMIKAVDRQARITDVRVTAKSGGRSGNWVES